MRSGGNFSGARSIWTFDPQSGASFFERLRLDPSSATTVDAEDAAAVQVSAAFNKHSADLRLVLADSPEPQLRFAAAPGRLSSMVLADRYLTSRYSRAH